MMTTTKLTSTTCAALFAIGALGMMSARAHADAPPKADDKPAVEPLKPVKPAPPADAPKPPEHCNEAAPVKFDAAGKLDSIDLPGVKLCPMLARPR